MEARVKSLDSFFKPPGIASHYYDVDRWSSLLLLAFARVNPKLKKLQHQTRTTYWPEVESRTQGSRPRPRTQKKSEAKAKAKDSPSEDRTSRGQGQECSRPRPRTKDTGASVLQKKSLQKFFSGDLQFVGVPRIYWDKPKPQIE